MSRERGNTILESLQVEAEGGYGLLEGCGICGAVWDLWGLLYRRDRPALLRQERPTYARCESEEMV